MYLRPCRPDFAQTMTDEERAIMYKHVGYWTEYMNKGVVLVFGPVMDPKAVYGIGIAAVDNEDELTELIKNDPATAINKYEYFPMRAIVPGK